MSEGYASPMAATASGGLPLSLDLAAVVPIAVAIQIDLKRLHFFPFRQQHQLEHC